MTDANINDIMSIAALKRHPDWKPEPNSLSGDDASKYIRNFAHDIAQAKKGNGLITLVPPIKKADTTNGPHYNAQNNNVIGLASGQSLVTGAFLKVQEEYPQLTRLFVSTHEGFHFLDFNTGYSAKIDGKRYPGLYSDDGKMNLEVFNNLPISVQLKATQTNEVFADAAAAVYLLDKIPGNRTEAFLQEFEKIRKTIGNDDMDPSHKSDRTMMAAIQAYREAVTNGTIIPGHLTAAQSADFVAPIIGKGLDGNNTLLETPTTPTKNAAIPKAPAAAQPESQQPNGKEKTSEIDPAQTKSFDSYRGHSGRAALKALATANHGPVQTASIDTNKQVHTRKPIPHMQLEA